MDAGIQSFVNKTKPLIDLERQEEVQETKLYRAASSREVQMLRLSCIHFTNTQELEQKGIYLHRLLVSDESTGLYGRTLITFEVDVNNITSTYLYYL